ncbi:hypothetical protein EWI07_13215 [Sporolactobacillus sp. THM7-4]|nr:hypothetical protein EWI07_13215 [Sporolactobacillus sp. THM7-4]
MLKNLSAICCFLAVFLGFSSIILAKEPSPSLEKLPKSVVDISKENTYPNPSNNASELVPSAQTRALLKTSNVTIENPTLIKLFNESTINPSRWSIGYYARIYLGSWPLNYTSNETTINWEYKKVNENTVDARGSNIPQKITYMQTNHVKVKGGLTSEVPQMEEVNKLIMAKTMRKTHLPISFSTVIGNGTKVDRPYQVQPKKIGNLYGYIPAVNEKGKISYGEVYIIMKGGKASLEVKNVVEQGIGAWMPVQDHLTLRYNVR